MGTRRRLSLRCVAFVFGAYISIVVVFSVHLLSFTDTHRDHMHRFMYESGITKSKVKTVDDDRAKTGNLRHQNPHETVTASIKEAAKFNSSKSDVKEKPKAPEDGTVEKIRNNSQNLFVDGRNGPEKPKVLEDGTVEKFRKNSQNMFVDGRNGPDDEDKEAAVIAPTWAEYRRLPNAITGNVLIDEYGRNDDALPGEGGRGVNFTGEDEIKANEILKVHRLNGYASDVIPLNRKVPDSRINGCRNLTYPEDLPSASIIIPFYDEWPTVLLRTIYSIVIRTPKKFLEEIILVDDASEMIELKESLDEYISTHFPKGLVKLIRAPERGGLIKARMLGWKQSTGDVIVIFDSHMEVNVDWLQPLLTEIKHDRKTVAMGMLDYIRGNNMEYHFRRGDPPRYGFDWRLVFFETTIPESKRGKSPQDTKPGVVMVGQTFAMDSKYFGEIGAFDEGMSIWGGENLELAWRVWMCGGRLVHVPCSRVGHLARAQPYSFPGGKQHVKVYNYKRAVEVWMEPEHIEIIQSILPGMKEIDAGDLTERLELKKRLQCKPFSWFLDNIWPELFVYSKDVLAWGSARNNKTNMCLDNGGFLFEGPRTMLAQKCTFNLAQQGFSITTSKLLRTTLQCVILIEDMEGTRPKLKNCLTGPTDTWSHDTGLLIKHERTGLCLDLDETGPIMNKCDTNILTQLWQFNTYVKDA